MAFCCLLIPGVGTNQKIRDVINVQVAQVLTRSFSLWTPGGKDKSWTASGGPRELPTRIRAQPPRQLSPTTLEVLAPKWNLTRHSFPSFPVTRFCAFSTNRFLFSAAKIIYWFPLFSLAESSSTPTPRFSGQTLCNSAGISSAPRWSSILPSSRVLVLSCPSSRRGITSQ